MDNLQFTTRSPDYNQTVIVVISNESGDNVALDIYANERLSDRYENISTFLFGPDGYTSRTVSVAAMKETIEDVLEDRSRLRRLLAGPGRGHGREEETEEAKAGKEEGEAGAAMSLHQLGADHAQEQLESDHFRNWVLDELHNPPEDRITDPRQIARNMLQQLVWDTERQLRVEDVVGRSLTRAETKEFMDGFREAAKSRESLEWLTEIVSEEMDAGTMSETAAKFRVGDAVAVSAPHGVERGKIVGPARRTGDVTLQIDFGGTVQPFRRDKEGNWRDPGGTQVQIAVASGGMNEAPRKGRTIKADDGSIVAHVHPKPYSGLERTQWVAVLTKTGAKSWDIGRYGAPVGDQGLRKRAGDHGSRRVRGTRGVEGVPGLGSVGANDGAAA